MAFGYAEAANGRWAHTACTQATFWCRNTLPCDLPSSDETRPLKSLFTPHASETLGSSLSRHWLWYYRKTLRQSALIWLSEWLLNWQYLVLCFGDTGFKGASSCPALSQISLKGFKIPEADSLPVRVLGTEELCTATRHYLKNTRLLTSRGRESWQHFSVSELSKPCTICQTVKPFSVGHLPFQIIFKNCFYKIL